MVHDNLKLTLVVASPSFEELTHTQQHWVALITAEVLHLQGDTSLGTDSETNQRALCFCFFMLLVIPREEIYRQ